MLLAPLLYWDIRHPVKGWWDVIWPIVGSVSLTAALLLWPAIPSPFRAGGYLAGLQGLYPILGGFFVAALTLLSTADTPALQQPLAGSPPVRMRGESAPLGRRRFLCLLFGYLAFSCFGLYAAGFIATLIAPGMKIIVPAWSKIWLSAAFLGSYNFWLSHMFVSTLVGLYYFTDRLQRADPEVIRDEVPLVAAE